MRFKWKCFDVNKVFYFLFRFITFGNLIRFPKRKAPDFYNPEIRNYSVSLSLFLLAQCPINFVF